MNDVIIVGGGLAGLFNAILLNRAGFKVLLVERKSYPFHRVCGEYISNEVVPFLSMLEIDLDELDVARISRLEITAASGAKISKKLDLGGFGLSRFTFDNYLYRKAQSEGVNFLLNTKVENILFVDDQFEVSIPGNVLLTPLVIGSFGKRSNLDKKLNRDFFFKRSPYFAVKFHIRADFPADLIQLNNYKNGYCGVSKIEGDKYCMCYLAHRDDLRIYGDLQEFEKNIVCKNPYLKNLFDTAEFILDKPEVINEICFEKKKAVEGHILMCGDTAGMIAPLCGNGMGMAIHSAKILSQTIKRYYNFSHRLWTGRQLQHLLGSDALTTLSLKLLNKLPLLADHLISKTHGSPFDLNG
jgi:flavin-dependent dehydrogenase